MGMLLTGVGKGQNAATLPFSDDFARADGALGNGWIGATWAIASGVVVNTPTGDGELIVNGDMELDADWLDNGSPTTNERSNEQAHGGTYSRKIVVDAAIEGCRQSGLGSNGSYIRGSAWLYCAAGGAFLLVGGSGSPATSAAAWTQRSRVIRLTAAATVAAASTSATATFYADDVSAEILTLPTMFATRPACGVADVTIQAEITLDTTTVRAPAGLVMNMDNAANPQNFVIAWHDGVVGKVFLETCTNGTWATVAEPAAVYLAGAVLKVVKSGTDYTVWYRGVNLGTFTINAATIINNTIHGLFSTWPGHSIDDFSLSA